MKTAACFLSVGLACSITAAFGQTETINLINDPRNAVLNARMEYPYLNPAHCDKFFGKLPRLYLHGMWKLMVVPNDGDPPGREDYIFADRGSKAGYHAFGYDDSDWEDFYVPQKILLEKDNKYGIEFRPTSSGGKSRYFTQDGYSYLAVRFLIAKAHRGKRVVLYVSSANNQPVIWVNGGEVGRPRNCALAGNADRHWIDITEHVRSDAPNRLVVRTYNIFLVPPRKEIDWNCNGIWKPVWLEFWPKTRVAAMKITPGYPDEIHCELSVAHAGSPAASEIKLLVKPWRGQWSQAVDDSGRTWSNTLGSVGLRTGANKVESSIRLPGIRPWHMGHPYLYSLKVLIGGELAGWDTFGMRSVKRQGRRILINGTPAYFFGIGLSDGAETTHIQRKHGGDIAISLNKNNFLAKLFSFYRQDMNANAVMRDGYQPHIFYQICDELGLARWDEPLLWGGGGGRPRGLRGDKVIRNPWQFRGFAGSASSLNLNTTRGLSASATTILRSSPGARQLRCITARKRISIPFAARCDRSAIRHGLRFWTEYISPAGKRCPIPKKKARGNGGARMKAFPAWTLSKHTTCPCNTRAHSASRSGSMYSRNTRGRARRPTDLRAACR